MASLFIIERSRIRSSWIDRHSGLTGNRYAGRSSVQDLRIQDKFKWDESSILSDRTQIVLISMEILA